MLLFYLILLLETIFIFVSKLDFYLSTGNVSKLSLASIIILVFLGVIGLFLLYQVSSLLIKKTVPFNLITIIEKNKWFLVGITFGFLALTAIIIFFKDLPVPVKNLLDGQVDTVFYILLISVEVFWFIQYRQSDRIKIISHLVLKLIHKYAILLIFLGATAYKILVLSPNAVVMIAPTDGIKYWQMARSIFLGAPDILQYNHYPYLYPFFISPAFAFPVEKSLYVISLINAIISSSVIFPVYLIAKRFLSINKAILFCLVAMTHPFHVVYTLYPASENLYYPLFMWVLYFVDIPPVNKSSKTKWNIFTGILIGLAYMTRYQTLPVIPAYLVIWWLKPSPESGYAHIVGSYKTENIGPVHCAWCIYFNFFSLGSSRTDSGCSNYRALLRVGCGFCHSPHLSHQDNR